VFKCGKTLLRPGLRPDPAGGAYSAPPDLLAGGRGLAAPPQEPHPRCRPFRPPTLALLASLLGATTARGLCPVIPYALISTTTDHSYVIIFDLFDAAREELLSNRQRQSTLVVANDTDANGDVVVT